MKRGKILIVDDNEDILFTLKMLLRPIAESITTLNDPRELLPVISRTRFDVILLDMNFRQDAVSGKEGFHWLVENPLKVAPLIQSNLTPVKFFHSFILFILVFFVFFLSVMPGSTLNFVYKYNDSFLLLHLRSDSPKSSIRIA